ncbi:MAG: GTP-binding protein [Pseudomonadota bacterium]
MTDLDLSRQIPVVLLTGFLGSGKTTLLQRLVRQPGMQGTAVIVNEFGEIALDHDLIEVGEETVIELDGGCLCCTVKSELMDTLKDLYRRHVQTKIELRRVVIETTGLADPVPILAGLLADTFVGHFFRLAAVVTLVDAVSGGVTLSRHEEARRQVAVADRLILTKLDMVTTGSEVTESLRRLNPTAPIAQASMGDVEMSFVLEDGLYDPGTKTVDVQAWLRAEAFEPADHHHHDHAHDHHHDHDHHDVNRHSERIRAFCLRRDEPVPTQAFEDFLNALRFARGPDLLRVKGIVCLAEEPEHPLVFHAAQHAIHPTVSLDQWPSEDRTTRIVFIVDDIEPHQIESMLDSLAAC